MTFIYLYIHKQHKKYQANISKNGVRKFLGLFNTPEEASECYVAASKRYHKDFARLL